jgi:hypothetical protein
VPRKRRSGITREIVLQTDGGSEFGGVSVDKLEYRNKAIFSVLNAKLVHIPKGKKEFNAYCRELAPEGRQ